MSNKSKSKGGKKQPLYSNLGFGTYVHKTVSAMNSDHSIGRRGAEEVSELILFFIVRVSAATRELLLNSGRQTAGLKELRSALAAVLPGHLAKGTTAAANQAVERYAPKSAGMPKKKGSAKKTAGSSRSNAAKAGIILPPRRILRVLEANIGLGYRKSGTSGVFLAAAAEHIIREVLEGAIANAGEADRKRVIPRHILLAIRGNDDLDAFFDRRRIILAGGVVPHIHHELENKKSKKSAEISPEL